MILTFNEEANLEDTLNGLTWAKQILIVDSKSSDSTIQIASNYKNVKVVTREFDHFADQCNFGLAQIDTTWVLSIDADYRCSESFATELLKLIPTNFSGFQSRFKYAVYGRTLRATLYPPRTVLYRKDVAEYCRDGHAHKVRVSGKIGTLSTPIVHDDHKPLADWFQSQLRYGRSEADKLQATPHKTLDAKDRIRKWIVFAPLLTLFYCLFVKRLVLDGWPGMFYTAQRVFAELVLAIYLLDRRLR